MKKVKSGRAFTFFLMGPSASSSSPDDDESKSITKAKERWFRHQEYRSKRHQQMRNMNQIFANILFYIFFC